MTGLPLRLLASISLLFTAIGVWILIAPTAVGYQAAGLPRAQSTYNDITVGAVLILSSLGLLTAQVTTTMRTRLRAAADAGN